MTKSRKAKGLIGRIVGERYRIAERIGAGAMATIYRAHRIEDNLELALKVVLPKLAKNRTVAARIQREAKAASKLDHPGCVKIYDWGVDGETLYIAMELIEGEDVFELIQREKRLTQLHAVDIALEVLDVLAMAHAAGVVHRDLKPENIMLLSQPGGGHQLKILDFGIAKLIGPDLWSEETVPEKLTRAGSAVGTPSHMAPEQARGVEVDGRADIYACGVLLYETITGHLPFEGKSPIEVAVKQVRDPPRPPSEHLPEIHPDIERIILRCMEKDPVARWHSAEALSDQLRIVRADLVGGPAPLTAPPTGTRPVSGTVVLESADELSTLNNIPPHLRALMEQAQRAQAQGDLSGDDDNLATLHFDGSKSTFDDEVTLLGDRGAALKAAVAQVDSQGVVAQPKPLTGGSPLQAGTLMRGGASSPLLSGDSVTAPHTAPVPQVGILAPGAGANQSPPATEMQRPAPDALQAAMEGATTPGGVAPPGFAKGVGGQFALGGSPTAGQGAAGQGPSTPNGINPSVGQFQIGPAQRPSGRPPAEPQVVLSTYGTQPTHSSRNPGTQGQGGELDKLLSTIPSAGRKWLFVIAIVAVMLVVLVSTFLLVR